MGKPVTVVPPPVILPPSTRTAEPVVVTPTLIDPPVRITFTSTITSTSTAVVTHEQITSTPAVSWAQRTVNAMEDPALLFECCRLCGPSHTTEPMRECPPGTFSNEVTGECEEILPM
ncbi:hypothetical protein TYRP_001908 [Tyrophagus putrescentiae]|nr:hypothetical protein TYRP_001908 [Tyrophagus putrescentiae]